MSSKTVLIADDERTVRHTIRKILGDEYVVLEAADGESAVEMASAHKPDLILMDIMMPKMDGYTACSLIRADGATKAIPIVMLTGVDHELNKKLAKEIGADGYITKPFDLRDLMTAIRQFFKNAK